MGKRKLEKSQVSSGGGGGDDGHSRQVCRVLIAKLKKKMKKRWNA
jgi:hypothetical protein